jgi:hypothetical protein
MQPGTTKPDRPAAIHPPWQTGQYVTYVLDRDDGTWAAFALRVLGQDDTGVWVIRGDFKTVGGECHVWFRSGPAGEQGGFDPAPVQQQLGRRFLPEDDSPNAWLAQPEMQITLALNLFLVRQMPAAIDALAQPGRPARHACGIDTVYPFVSWAPNFQKHHDLCPRVPVTGVAGVTVDGTRNPIAVTSFGCNDPHAATYTFDDWVDWSHVQPTRHQGFSLCYPATWFLLPTQSKTPGETLYFAQLGGNTCAVSFSVSLRSGTPDDLRKHQQETLARLRTPGNDLTPDPQPLRFAAGSEGIAGTWARPGIVGVYRTALFPSPDGTRLAHINLFGCVSRNHPDREGRLASMAPAFGAILESMQFT